MRFSALESTPHTGLTHSSVDQISIHHSLNVARCSCRTRSPASPAFPMAWATHESECRHRQCLPPTFLNACNPGFFCSSLLMAPSAGRSCSGPPLPPEPEISTPELSLLLSKLAASPRDAACALPESQLYRKLQLCDGPLLCCCKIRFLWLCPCLSSSKAAFRVNSASASRFSASAFSRTARLALCSTTWREVSREERQGELVVELMVPAKREPERLTKPRFFFDGIFC